jgi:hypothetical protein
MGLLQNGYCHNLSGKIVGATNLDGANPFSQIYWGHRTAANRNIFASEGITDDLVSVPSGARPSIAWIMARKAGGLSSANEAVGTSTASLSMASGWNLAASTTATSSGQATLQLVVSMVGTSTGSATVTGNILAALGMVGSSTGSGTATGTINAIAWAYGEAVGTSTATLTRYATGRLYGAITPFTDLSPEGLASAVIAAAQISPIHSDVRKVNSYTVTGDGQSGSEWGP